MLKKLIFLSLILMPIKVYALSAESAILIDANSKRVLFSQNAYEPKLIASTTKIMTALVAIENGNLKKKITVDEDVLKAYGSAIYIEVGEKLTLEDLLYGLMLRSGNDAALVIAKSVGKTPQKFVELMNDKAQEIGMEKTVFYNPHGLEEENGTGNTSTAYDMALLMQEAMQNKTFQKITKTKTYTVKTNKKTYVWQNKNKLLRNYEFATGGKTGFTQKARRTLVTSAQKGKEKLIAVTLNDPNDFANHQKLYEQYFAKYDLVKIVDHKKYQITDNAYKNDELYLKNDVNIMLTKEEKKNINIKVNLYKPEENSSPVVGYLSIMLGNQEISRENIYSKKQESKEKKSFFSQIKSWFS